MTTAAQDDVGEVEWNLAPLVDGGGDDAVAELLDEAARRARDFSAAYAGKVAEFDSDTLREAATEDPATGALLQDAQERGAAVETELLFFDLEWQALPEERAEQLLQGDGLEFVAHHLRVSRRLGPHRLTEPEERVLTELRVTGRSAWSRLFEEQVAAVEVPLDGGTPLEVALSRLFSPDRDERRTAAEAVTAGLRPG